MAQALPLLKLSGLFIKTIAKPMSSLMKSEAPKYPRFAKLCVSCGQSMHSLYSRVNVLASGHKFVGVKPLSNDEALSKGVEYVSEFLVIVASGSIIVVEYWRSEKKNAIKAAAAAAKEAKYQLELQTRFAQIECEIKALVQALPKSSQEQYEVYKTHEFQSAVQSVMQSKDAENAPPSTETAPSTPSSSLTTSNSVNTTTNTIEVAVLQPIYSSYQSFSSYMTQLYINSMSIWKQDTTNNNSNSSGGVQDAVSSTNSKTSVPPTIINPDSQPPTGAGNSSSPSKSV